MDKFESLSHSKWECKYHVVFIPKCRRRTLYVQLREHLGEVFRKLAIQKESRVEEGHLMIDHVHMLLSIPPKYAVSQVVGFIKGKSAIHLARVYAERLSRAQVRSTVRHLRRWAEQRPKATPAALSPLGEPACLRHIGPPALERALADVRVFDTLTPDSLAQVRDRYRRAARRLADVADLLRDALPAGRIQPLLAQARLVSHALGRARDAQRAAREALRYLAALPEQASPTLRAAVMAFAAAMDALAHEHLSTVLSQPPFPEPWS